MTLSPIHSSLLLMYKVAYHLLLTIEATRFVNVSILNAKIQQFFDICKSFFIKSVSLANRCDFWNVKVQPYIYGDIFC